MNISAVCPSLPASVAFLMSVRSGGQRPSCCLGPLTRECWPGQMRERPSRAETPACRRRWPAGDRFRPFPTYLCSCGTALHCIVKAVVAARPPRPRGLDRVCRVQAPGDKGGRATAKRNAMHLASRLFSHAPCRETRPYDGLPCPGAEGCIAARGARKTGQRAVGGPPREEQPGGLEA